MIHAAAFLLDIAGFILLLLSMNKHQQDWLHRKLAPARARLLRRAGFTALALGFVACGAGLGWGYGTVSGFGWLTAAALLVLSANCNRAAIQRRLKGTGR